MTDSALDNVQRFFLHYPEGGRLYVCVVDQERLAFDFTDNTFKLARNLSSLRDACAYAVGNSEERADHGYSYSVELDLTRLLKGNDPETVPVEGAIVTVHWLQQVGEDPDVSVDKRVPHTCSLRNVGGRFEPANKWDADHLDENHVFEQRAKFEKEYQEFVLREIDGQDSRRERLVAAVRGGDVSGVLRVLTEDICSWAGNLKRHCLHQMSHLAKDPSFVRSRMVPKDAPFQVVETWAVRPWIGCPEAFDLLEFHKSAEFARSFSARLDRLHEARVMLSQQVIEYTVRHRGEDAEGMFALDEARKNLKHLALGVAEYIDLIAQQFEVGNPPKGGTAAGNVAMATDAAQGQDGLSGGAAAGLGQPQAFQGGALVFHGDRVELCGVDICSGPRSRSRRVVLELLGKQGSDGSFVAYSGAKLETKAKEMGAKGTAAQWIRDLRDDIMEALRNQANIVSERKEVILNRGSGYQFAESVILQNVPTQAITDITDTEDEPDVRDGDVRDVFNVRDDEAERRRVWILEQLANGVRLKAPMVAERFERSKKTAQRDLDALRDEGKIEFVGDPRTGYYRLTGGPNAG